MRRPPSAAVTAWRSLTTFRAGLMNLIQFTIIKGNMGEIATIAGQSGASSRGVDSAGTLKDPGRVVRDLARTERSSNSLNTVQHRNLNYRDVGCVVVMTGVTDWVSDGKQTFKLENGVEMLGHITGSGCMTGRSAFSALLNGAYREARELYWMLRRRRARARP